MNLIFSFIAIILTFRCKGGSKNFRRESEVNLHKERTNWSVKVWICKELSRFVELGLEKRSRYLQNCFGRGGFLVTIKQKSTSLQIRKEIFEVKCPKGIYLLLMAVEEVPDIFCFEKGWSSWETKV